MPWDEDGELIEPEEDPEDDELLDDEELDEDGELIEPEEDPEDDELLDDEELDEDEELERQFDGQMAKDD